MPGHSSKKYVQIDLFDGKPIPPGRYCRKCHIRKPYAEFITIGADGKPQGRRVCHQCRKDHSKAMQELPRGRKFRRKWFLMQEYGITMEDYEAMHERQGGLCAICGQPETFTNPRSGLLHELSVDHSHATGVVRSLLCRGCNNGLGQFKDDPALLRAAADYLQKHSG